MGRTKRFPPDPKFYTYPATMVARSQSIGVFLSGEGDCFIVSSIGNVHVSDLEGRLIEPQTPITLDQAISVIRANELQAVEGADLRWRTSKEETAARFASGEVWEGVPRTEPHERERMEKETMQAIQRVIDMYEAFVEALDAAGS